MVKNKNILVTGLNGQLGSTIKRISNHYKFNFFFTSKKTLDLTNYNLLRNYIKKNNINIIINCAAYTDVVNAEISKDLADAINIKAVDYIAKICHEFNIRLIHISSDYVFDGNRSFPYSEVEKTNPVNYYGLSKLLGEKEILKYNLNKSLIIRTSWLYSDKQNNFVKKILNKIHTAKKVYVTKEEIGSPTNALDLARAILEIIPKMKDEGIKIYHFSNGGYCSRYEFAVKINEIIGGKSLIVAKNNLSKFNIRPKFSALDPTAFSDYYNIRIINWIDSLRFYLKRKNINY